MSIKYTIIIKSNHWPRRLAKVKNIVKKISKYNNSFKYNRKFNYYCNIVLANDFFLKKINNLYRKQNKSTNVLTFISKIKINRVIEKHCDIIISANKIIYESNKTNKNFYNHFTHLIIHSILHINGYLHENNKNFLIMRKKEIKILNLLGISNPYL